MIEFTKLRNDRGQLLVQALLAMGIISGFSLIFFNLLANQSQLIRGLNERQAALEFRSFLSSALSSGEVCVFEANNASPQLTVDVSTPDAIQNAFFDFQTIHLKGSASSPILAEVGQSATGNSIPLYIKSIQIKNLQGSGSTFLGNWIIAFDNSRLVRPMKDISFKTYLKLDTSTPTKSKIVQCSIGSEVNTKVIFPLKSTVLPSHAGDIGTFGAPLYFTCLRTNSTNSGASSNSTTCPPIDCPVGTTELSIYVELAGILTRYNRATGSSMPVPIYNTVRLCEISGFAQIFILKSSVSEKPGGVDCKGGDYLPVTVVPTGVFSCVARACPNGSTEIATYFESSPPGVNLLGVHNVRICVK